MGKKRSIDRPTEYAPLRRVIYSAMNEQNLRWVDVIEGMHVPLCIATLAAKCQNPGKMTIAELWDIANALGISREEIREAL